MLGLDTATEFGARVECRLGEETVIWLTTVSGDMTPQPSPVWFLWDGESFLVYSQPNTPKVRNIERNPVVALNFNSDGQGGDIIVFTGEARIEGDVPPADAVPAYLTKYRDHISRIGMTPRSFSESYSVPIRVTPTKVRGH